MSAGRKAADARGRRAEDAATAWLMLKGYRILARRARTPLGEIDVIALRGRVLAFVEVKARAQEDVARYALTPAAQARIARAADAWAAGQSWTRGLERRLDLMLVLPGRWPRHIRGAWALDA